MTVWSNTFVAVAIGGRDRTHAPANAAQMITEQLVRELPNQGIKVASVDSDDVGFYLTCLLSDESFRIVVSESTAGDAPRCDILCPDNRRGAWFQRQPDSTEHVRLVVALDAILRASDHITDVRWYPRYESPSCRLLMSGSESPLATTAPCRRVNFALMLPSALGWAYLAIGIVTTASAFAAFVFSRQPPATSVATIVVALAISVAAIALVIAASNIVRAIGRTARLSVLIWILTWVVVGVIVFVSIIEVIMLQW